MLAGHRGTTVRSRILLARARDHRTMVWARPSKLSWHPCFPQAAPGDGRTTCSRPIAAAVLIIPVKGITHAFQPHVSPAAFNIARWTTAGAGNLRSSRVLRNADASAMCASEASASSAFSRFPWGSAMVVCRSIFRRCGDRGLLHGSCSPSKSVGLALHQPDLKFWGGSRPSLDRSGQKPRGCRQRIWSPKGSIARRRMPDHRAWRAICAHTALELARHAVRGFGEQYQPE